MFKYLGEDSSEFKALVLDNVIDKKINNFKISNEKGIFNAHKVDVDDIEGFVYYNTNGNFYEFASSEVCKSKEFKSSLIAEKELVPFSKIQKSLLEKRDGVTKTIKEHSISFLDKDLNKMEVIGTEAKLYGHNGFIFKQIKNNDLSESHGIVQNMFVKEKEVLDLGVVAEKSLLTNQEQIKGVKEKIQNTFLKNMSTLNTIGIFIDDASPNDFNLMSSIEKMITEDLQAPELKGDVDPVVFMSRVKELSIEKDDKLRESKLLDYNLSVKIPDFEVSDKMMIIINDKKGKMLSELTISDFRKESAEVPYYDIDDKESQEILPIIVLDFEYSSTLKIIENYKEVDFNDSKFKKVFEVFDLKAYVNDRLSLRNDQNYIENSDTGISYEISDCDLTSQKSINKELVHAIETDRSLKKVLNELKNKSTPKFKKQK